MDRLSAWVPSSSMKDLTDRNQKYILEQEHFESVLHQLGSK